MSFSGRPESENAASDGVETFADAAVDPARTPPDDSPAELQYLTPEVGSVWIWEPLKPHARCVAVVTATKWNREEVWIESDTVPESKRVWNDLSRWIEATVFVAPSLAEADPEDLVDQLAAVCGVLHNLTAAAAALVSVAIDGEMYTAIDGVVNHPFLYDLRDALKEVEAWVAAQAAQPQHRNENTSPESRPVGADSTGDAVEAQSAVPMQALIPASEIPGIADPSDGLPASTDSAGVAAQAHQPATEK